MDSSANTLMLYLHFKGSLFAFSLVKQNVFIIFKLLEKGEDCIIFVKLLT